MGGNALSVPSTRLNRKEFLIVEDAVVHCPNVDPWDGHWEPDANPVHCSEEQPEFEGMSYKAIK